MISAKERAIAVFVHAAPLLVGIPLYLAVFSYAGMLVYFFPGVFMALAGLVVAAIVRRIARPGFVRAEADGSLRFHGIVAVGSLVVLALCFVALFGGGIMFAASTGAALLGVLLPLFEIGRALMYGIGAWRASAPLPAEA